MSNLTSTVKFDILRGWPFGGAVEESYKVAAGVTLKEGQLCEFTATGDTAGAVPTVKLMASAVTVNAPVFMVIQGNDQFDAAFVGKVVTLRGAFTIKTEKYIAGIVVGSPLTWDLTSTTEGYLKAGTPATDKIIGFCSEVDSANGFIIAQLHF